MLAARRRLLPLLLAVTLGCAHSSRRSENLSDGVWRVAWGSVLLAAALGNGAAAASSAIVASEYTPPGQDPNLMPTVMFGSIAALGLLVSIPLLYGGSTDLRLAAIGLTEADDGGAVRHGQPLSEKPRTTGPGQAEGLEWDDRRGIWVRRTGVEPPIQPTRTSTRAMRAPLKPASK